MVYRNERKRVPTMNEQEYMQHKQHAFEVYCKTVLRNRARNIHSRLNYTKQHEVSLENLEPEQMACAVTEDQYNVSSAVVSDHLGNRYNIDEELAAALSILLPKYREVIIRAYFLENSDTEIAEELGISLSTVNDRKFSGLRRLKEKLRDGYER